MITIISRWENDPDIASVEYRFWQQLKAFGVDRFIFVTRKFPENITAEHYDTMEEALDKVEGNRVFLESTGSKGLSDLPSRDEDVVFILGVTSRNNVKYAKEEELYRINEPRVTDMYPTCAGAIALAYWDGQ